LHIENPNFTLISTTINVVFFRKVRRRQVFIVVKIFVLLSRRHFTSLSRGVQVEHPEAPLPADLAGAVSTISNIFSAEGDDGTVLSSSTNGAPPRGSFRQGGGNGQPPARYGHTCRRLVVL
jgi:hypothetical protein